MDWSVISICQGIGLILSFWALFRDEVDKYVLEESYKINPPEPIPRSEGLQRLKKSEKFAEPSEKH